MFNGHRVLYSRTNADVIYFETCFFFSPSRGGNDVKVFFCFRFSILDGLFLLSIRINDDQQHFAPSSPSPIEWIVLSGHLRQSLLAANSRQSIHHDLLFVVGDAGCRRVQVDHSTVFGNRSMGDGFLSTLRLPGCLGIDDEILHLQNSPTEKSSCERSRGNDFRLIRCKSIVFRPTRKFFKLHELLN